VPNTSATGGFLLPTSPDPVGDLDLDRKLNDLISGAAGLPGDLMRPRYQREPPPRPPPDTDWGSFGVIELDRVGPNYIQHVPDGNGRDVMKCEWDLRIFVSFYGPNCGRIAQRFLDGLEETQNHESAVANGLHLREMRTIAILGEQVNMSWYRRAELEILIRHKFSRDYDVLNILSAAGMVTSQGTSPEGPVEVDWNTELVQ